MKKIMKVVSLILTFAILASMVIVPSVVTSADPVTGDAKITVNRPNDSSVDLSELGFVAYRILIGSGSGDAISYSIPEVEGLKQAIVDAIHAGDAKTATTITIDSSDNDIVEAIRAFQSNLDNFQKFASSIEGAVTGDLKTKMADYTYSPTTQSESSIEFTKLPVGYYIIDCTAGVGNTAAVMLQAVDEEVEMIAKISADPTIDKVIVTGTSGSDDTTAKGQTKEIGSTVTYKITTQVPNTRGFSTNEYVFKVTDTLSKGLLFKEDTLKVYVDQDVDVTLDKDTDYTVSYKNLQSEDPAEGVPNGQYKSVIIIQLKPAGLQKLNGLTSDGAEAPGATDYSGADLIITYDAEITEHVTLGQATPNDAQLEYSNDPKSATVPGPPVTVTNDPNVYTYGIKLNKTGDDNLALEGAVFKLYKSTNASAFPPIQQRKYLEIDGADGVSNGIYTLKHDGTDLENGDEWKTSDGTASKHNTKGSKFKTNSDGIIEIKGLMAGTYYLEEVEAPVGYNLAEVVQIKIDVEFNGTGAVETTTSKFYVGTKKTPDTAGKVFEGNVTDGYIPVAIKDEKGAKLPSTGGMGTTLIYTVGGLLVVIAGVLLISKRRMHAAR